MAFNAKEHRAKLQAKGLCTKCGKKPPKEGRLRCEPCLEKQTQQSISYQQRKRRGDEINSVGRPRTSGKGFDLFDENQKLLPGFE